MAEETNDGKYFFYNSMKKPVGNRYAYTVHNGKNYRRHYSSIDADVLFNGQFIEELVSIQWNEMQQTLPLIGYNSYIFDEIAQGSRIIQGQFTIHFVIPDYLNQIIESNIQDENIELISTEKRTHTSDPYAPHFSTGFDIAIYYGEKNKKDRYLGEAPGILLKQCYIQSRGQAMDVSGANLVEIYSFVARDKEDLR